MGDRTTTRTTVAASDLDAAKDVVLGSLWRHTPDGFVEEFPDGDGTVMFILYEIDCGGEREADTMQKAGIPFVIEHDAGASYPHGWIVFDGETRAAFHGHGDGLMIRFDPATGDANADDLARAREFTALRARTYNVLRCRGAACLEKPTITNVPDPAAK